MLQAAPAATTGAPWEAPNASGEVTRTPAPLWDVSVFVVEVAVDIDRPRDTDGDGTPSGVIRRVSRGPS